MKKHGNLLKFILAITSALVCIPISAQFDGGVISPVEYPVSQTEAFTVLKTHFLDREVDYYLMDGYSANEWTFFVDAKPNSPWSHTCYVATVLKNKSSITMTPTVHLSEMITPPVTFCDAVENGSQLIISSVTNGQNMFTVFVEEGAEEATLDISDLASGIYSVSLVKGGKVVDTKCFSNK